MQSKNNKEFSKILEVRTKRFAVEVLKFGKKVARSNEFDSIKNQLYRSATNIGANYREANRAKSRSDFRNKIRICEAEASETFYWIEIIEELIGDKNETILSLKKESSELLALFTSISNKLRVTKT